MGIILQPSPQPNCSRSHCRRVAIHFCDACGRELCSRHTLVRLRSGHEVCSEECSEAVFDQAQLVPEGRAS